MAIVEAAKIARHFSRDYLSNPDNNLITVTLLELYDSNKNPLNQKKVLKQKGYASIQLFELNDEWKLFTECSMLEHILSLSNT